MTDQVNETLEEQMARLRNERYSSWERMAENPGFIIRKTPRGFEIRRSVNL